MPSEGPLGLRGAQGGRYKDRLRAAQASFLIGMKGDMSLPPPFFFTYKSCQSYRVSSRSCFCKGEPGESSSPMLPQSPSVGLPPRQEGKTDRAVRVYSGPWYPHLMLFQAASESTGPGLEGHPVLPPHPAEKEDSSFWGSPQQRGCQFSLKSSQSHPPCAGSALLPSSR